MKEKLNRYNFFSELGLIFTTCVAYQSIQMFGNNLFGNIGAICGLLMVLLLVYLRNLK